MYNKLNIRNPIENEFSKELDISHSEYDSDWN